MVAKMRRKTGPKNRCTKEMAERAYKFCLLGLTSTELAFALSIAEQTILNWQKNYTYFNDAIIRGRQEADAKVVESLYKRACGYSHPETIVKVVDKQVVEVNTTKHYAPDTGAACFWLKNRTKKNEDPWLEIARTELTGKGGGPIQTQNLESLDLSDLTDEELAMVERIGLKIQPKKAINANSNPSS